MWQYHADVDVFLFLFGCFFLENLWDMGERESQGKNKRRVKYNKKKGVKYNKKKGVVVYTYTTGGNLDFVLFTLFNAVGFNVLIFFFFTHLFTGRHPLLIDLNANFSCPTIVLRESYNG